MAESIVEPGGFLPPSLPSPAPSNTSRSSNISNLPHPRSHPLRAGSAKEDAARRYVEARLLHISRRYVKKFQPHLPGEDVHGYDNMTDVCKDLGEVVDVLWLSGTLSLQVPYLLNIALSVTTYLPAFPPAPKATFALLGKLDHAFASLLKGEDYVTGEILPGFGGGNGKGMSKTDMVRIKSLVEITRVEIVEIMSKDVEEGPEDEGGESATETDDDLMDGESTWDPDEQKQNMSVAKVYEATIMMLSEVLDGRSTFESSSAQS